VQLAVLVDRGGRQLPIEPAFSAARVSLAPGVSLRLEKTEQGRFGFHLKTRESADAE
jgi:pyrimidine operon attenuation protein/uracil phosphoribosyltransferase